MIAGKDRKAVIENIRRCANTGQFHSKVELNDPVLTAEQSKAITQRYLRRRTRPCYQIKRALAVCIANAATRVINRRTEIKGLEKIPKDLAGVLITSNHFGPLENTIIRHLTHKMGRRRLGIISQVTNFAMRGGIGFLMNYADTIPVCADPRYLARDLPALLRERLVDKKDAVLLYPEQELWFNYRKPRPPKPGVYHYAAKLGVPILSCFVEIIDLDRDDTPDFKKVKYVLHVLGVLYPDKGKTVRENAQLLESADYTLKKNCYEAVYRKELSYKFECSDIAGWKGGQ